MFIRATTMTAVLTEGFFLDNATDKQIGDTVAEQRAFGVAYAKAILEYLGIPYKDEAPVFSDGESDNLYRVQLGAYREKSNALEMVAKAKKAGLDAIIKTEKA